MKRLSFLVALCGFGASAQVPDYSIDFKPRLKFGPATEAIAIYDSGKLVISISTKDAKVTLGEGVTLDEASKQFYAAFAKYFEAAKCPTPLEIKP